MPILSGGPGTFRSPRRQCITILLDPGTFLNTLAADLILTPPRTTTVAGSIDRRNCAGDMQLSATEKSKRLAQMEHFDIYSLRGLVPLMVLLAVILSGCGDKPPAQAAAAPLPVTVAQPTKRTVTDWDEFTGRFEAVEEGQVRVQGSEGNATLLTSIVTLDPIYIYFDVDEATYLKHNKLWSEGRRPSSRDTPNPVQVTLTGETKPSHDGKMDFLDNRLDVSTGTLRSRAVIPNKDLSILPGQFGRVRLIGSSPYEALLLPDTAIATDQSRKIVFVVKDDNTVEAKPVTLGPLDESLRVIRDGLNAEDRVIVDGIQRARVGAKVTPQTAPTGGKS